jgi:hypothetical protein
MGYKPRQYQRLGYRKLETNRLYEVWRKGKHTYVEWTPTPEPGFNRKSLRAWGEDIAAFSGVRPHAYGSAISHIRSTYGMESKYVHHVGYSRGGAFARELGGTGYGTFNMRTETQARGSSGHRVSGADFVHNRIVPLTNFLSRGYLKRKEYAPSSESAQGSNKRTRAGSLSSARPARDMSSGDAKYGGRFRRRVRRSPTSHPLCTRRLVQDYGSLNATNIIYQLYSHHADRDVLLNEFCRSLVVKLVHTMKGTIASHNDPICWPFPKSANLDIDYLDNIRIQYRDVEKIARPEIADDAGSGTTGGQADRHATYGAPFPSTAARYSPDIDDPAPAMSPICVYHKTAQERIAPGVGNSIGSAEVFERAQNTNKSLVELADELQKTFVYIFGHYRHLVPVRLQITRRMQNIEEVIYDDDNFSAASTKLSVTANHKLMNVSPAAGPGNKFSDDHQHSKANLLHTPLIGRLYEFTGDCPIVRDKHPAELHNLFPADRLWTGRLTIAGEHIHSKDDPSKNSIMHHPPNAANLFKNCAGTTTIKMQPGQIKKILIKMNLTTSMYSLTNRWRNATNSRVSLGGCTMIALHPMVRYDPALFAASTDGNKGDVLMLRSHTNTHYSAMTTFRRRPRTLLATEVSLVRREALVGEGMQQLMSDEGAYDIDGDAPMPTAPATGGDTGGVIQ